MPRILSISGTSRPDNYTSRALSVAFPSVLAGKPVALVGVAAGRIGAIKSLASDLIEFLKDYVCPKYILEERVRETVGEAWATSV